MTPSRTTPTRLPVLAGRLLRGLLLFVPLAVVAHQLHWSGAVVFACAALAIVPLAGVMGEATEALARRFGAGVGGLLNATFGNAAELVIALAALRRGLDDIVKASLTGSILGNSLLVLGAALFAGGLRRERQTFDRAAASMGSTLLALAAIGLLVPALFHVVASSAVASSALTAAQEALRERDLSLEIAVVLFAAYLLSLVFSLGTHRHLYAGEPGAGRHGAGEPAGAAWRPALLLLAATLLVAWMSELLVGAVDEASLTLGLTPVFVAVECSAALPMVATTITPTNTGVSPSECEASSTAPTSNSLIHATSRVAPSSISTGRQAGPWAAASARPRGPGSPA